MGKRVDPHPFIVIYTDLDGTLLDHETYSWEEARPALEDCKRRGVPVIMVSSKTRAEIEELGKETGLALPFVSENGGGIYFPPSAAENSLPDAEFNGGFLRISLGVPYARLVAALKKIRESSGWALRGFSDMDLKEISELSGLDLKTSELASKREYDEPFVIAGGSIDMDGLKTVAAERGLQVTEGGRFFHLHGMFNKGKAVERLNAWYRSRHPGLLSMALGDGPNDFEMFRVVDRPVLVRSGRTIPGADQIPGLRITGEIGPRGWNRAVLDFLDEYCS